MFSSRNIDALLQEFRDRKAMALFVGSGTDITNTVSESEKLTWNNLLAELTSAACIGDDESRALSNFTSPTFKAAVLKQKLGNTYIPIIQNWLYSRCNRDVLEESYKYYRFYIDNPSAVALSAVPFASLFVLADLILYHESIRVVFTQNYNNFLSEAMKILLEMNPERYGFRRGCIPVDVYDGWKYDPYDMDRFLIYHVHGFIPPPYEMIPKKESNQIVLSDEEFYNLSRDVFSWQNVSQLHYLTHYTCILVGLSLDDMTMLRLLRHARLEKSSEKVYWLRGGEGGLDGRLQLQTEYYESQHVHVVNDSDGYYSLYNCIVQNVMGLRKF